MLMKQIKLILMSSVLFCASSWGLNTDHLQICYILADSVVYQKNLHQMTYLKNVEITQGSTVLKADKVIVTLSPTTNKMIQFAAYGNPAQYSTSMENKPGKLEAQAKMIFYDPEAKTVLMKENAMVTEEKNVFKGSLIWYDIQQEIVRSASNNKDKTIIIIQPQKS